MNLNGISTAASVFTAVVIAATAIAAIIQLRHIRASNELAAFNEAMELWYQPDVQRGFRFIQNELASKLEDPDFRRGLDTSFVADHDAHPELNPVDFFDNIGSLTALGLLREDLILHPASQLIIDLWERTAPCIAIMRRKRGAQLYVSLEWLVSRAKRWERRYPQGLSPKGWDRLAVPDVWLDADRAAARRP